MTDWIQYKIESKLETGFGVLKNNVIHVFSGDMFVAPVATATEIPLTEVEIQMPCTPTKMLAMWNNFYSRAEQEGWDIPPEPLYFMKTNTSFLAHEQIIRRPKSYDGPVFFEGELGIVIGKKCTAVNEQDVKEYIFGYTCINDVTAKEILKRDASFPQWTRAKGFDTFGVFGPVITTGLDPNTLNIKSILDGEVLQDYPVTDMIFPPEKLVSLISQDVTLLPGDVICCGTGLGATAMKDGQTIEVSIDGIGVLRNQIQL